MTARRNRAYVCGHSSSELERLSVQGALFEEATRRIFEWAGLARGESVLDIGCGVGDVSFIAADRVGPSGSVLGIDRAPEAIAAAQARAAERGVVQVDFRPLEVEALPLSLGVDALVGRFVLMHQADPAGLLRRAARHVRPGGLVVLIESHLIGSAPGLHSAPHSPIYDRIMRWFVDVIRGAGAHPDMGLRLRQTFVDAGLPPPQLWLHGCVEGGTDAAIVHYVTESVRSLAPEARRLGIPTWSNDEIARLGAQLQAELASSGGVLTSPLLVGAWCRPTYPSLKSAPLPGASPRRKSPSGRRRRKDAGRASR